MRLRSLLLSLWQEQPDLLNCLSFSFVSGCGFVVKLTEGQDRSDKRKKTQTKVMAGDFVPESELNLKGWQRQFNSFTLRGRLNFVLATYGTLLGGVLLYKLKNRGAKK